MPTAVMRFKCGHERRAFFEYPRAARDWEKFAKTNLCDDCEIKKQQAQAQGR